jgi:hemerythrin superfamily protein
VISVEEKEERMDALKLLERDHRKVEKLFAEIEKAPKGKREELFKEIKTELTVHSELEEQLLYPAAREAKPTHELALESFEEHKQVKNALADLSETDKSTDSWLAGVTVLMEDVQHHVKEEEGELFPKIRRDVLSKEKLEEIGAQMESMKASLMAK